MSDLVERLERLGLSQYLEVFVAEGFDTWETVLDITESDLNSLNVKLGHRRKLQRAIAESRGQSSDRPLPIALPKGNSADGSYRSDDSATESKNKHGEAAPAGTTATGAKRKYRRHPKPDENAPERPPSAYVIFSNQVRETLRGQDLSFTEIAKVVGERWQVLAANEREACERQANAAKEKYYAEMTEYKKTPEFEAYQKYLEEFKAKHAPPVKATEGKRSKLETETSTSTRSSSHEQAERSAVRRVSSAQSDPYATGHYPSESSPPLGPTRFPSAPSYPSKITPPAGHPLSALNSPRLGEQYSPLSASPRPPSLHKENSYEQYVSAASRESRAGLESTLPFSAPAYGQPHQLSSTSPSSSAYGSHYQPAPIDLPSRRSFREPARLPSLSHEDTTLSSDSGGLPSTHPPYPPAILPVVDAAKSLRLLPQPVPSLGPASSPLDRPLPPAATSPQHIDYRTSSSLAALLRAGEMAREADDEEMDKASSP